MVLNIKGKNLLLRCSLICPAIAFTIFSQFSAPLTRDGNSLFYGLAGSHVTCVVLFEKHSQNNCELDRKEKPFFDQCTRTSYKVSKVALMLRCDKSQSV